LEQSSIPVLNKWITSLIKPRIAASYLSVGLHPIFEFHGTIPFYVHCVLIGELGTHTSDTDTVYSWWVDGLFQAPFRSLIHSFILLSVL